MFSTIEYKQYNHDTPTSLRVDRLAFTSICAAHNFSFVLASYINPPWSNDTLDFVATRHLEVFLRMVEHPSTIVEVIETRYSLAVLNAKCNSEVQQTGAMYENIQRDVEQQLDLELSHHKQQLATKGSAPKTPLQWDNLRKSLLRERLHVISTDCQQATKEIQSRYDALRADIIHACPNYLDLTDQFQLTAEHIFSFLFFAHHFKCEMLRDAFFKYIAADMDSFINRVEWSHALVPFEFFSQVLALDPLTASARADAAEALDAEAAAEESFQQSHSNTFDNRSLDQQSLAHSDDEGSEYSAASSYVQSSSQQQPHNLLEQVETLRQRVLVLLDQCDSSLNKQMQRHDPRVNTENSEQLRKKSLVAKTMRQIDELLETPRSFSMALEHSNQKLEALAKPGHARSMAKLRQHHKAGKVGSRSSMSLLSDVSEEDSAPQEDEEGVEGEWPPVASIKRFKTVDEVREAAAKLEDMKIDVGCTSGELNELSLLGRHLSLQHAYGLISHRARKLMSELQAPLAATNTLVAQAPRQ